MNIGGRIKARRIALNISQDDLAKKLGYKSRSSINKIELNGQDLPADKIYAIASALETTPAYIMGWSNSVDNTEEQLLEDFRSLSSEGKRDLLRYMRMLKADEDEMAKNAEENLG